MPPFAIKVPNSIKPELSKDLNELKETIGRFNRLEQTRTYIDSVACREIARMAESAVEEIPREFNSLYIKCQHIALHFFEKAADTEMFCFWNKDKDNRSKKNYFESLKTTAEAYRKAERIAESLGKRDLHERLRRKAMQAEGCLTMINIPRTNADLQRNQRL